MAAIEKITTEDGSTSFFNEKYNQCYHSRVGAYTEALEKHVKACQIQELASQKDKLVLLDVCFGLGYNSGVAIQEALAIKPELEIEVYALENDIEIVKKIGEMDVPENYQSMNNKLGKLAENFDSEKQSLILVEQNLRIEVLLGDARQRILDLGHNKRFDAVFFDPFSPKECPELWTAEFIGDVVSRTVAGGRISTYSSARIVKDNFQNNNCEITEGPKAGRRSGGVLARVLA